MPESFSSSEILQFAVKIEENGQAFYRLMSEKIDNEKIKTLFIYLADEEVRHKKYFIDILSSVENYESAQDYPEEYFTYLRSYANSIVFSGEVMGTMILDRTITSEKALDFAIRAELDSVHYYLEARNLVPDLQKEIVDKIIDEERKHYLKLMEVRGNG